MYSVNVALTLPLQTNIADLANLIYIYILINIVYQFLSYYCTLYLYCIRNYRGIWVIPPTPTIIHRTPPPSKKLQHGLCRPAMLIDLAPLVPREGLEGLDRWAIRPACTLVTKLLGEFIWSCAQFACANRGDPLGYVENVVQHAFGKGF